MARSRDKQVAMSKQRGDSLLLKLLMPLMLLLSISLLFFGLRFTWSSIFGSARRAPERPAQVVRLPEPSPASSPSTSSPRPEPRPEPVEVGPKPTPLASGEKEVAPLDVGPVGSPRPSEALSPKPSEAPSQEGRSRPQVQPRPQEGAKPASPPSRPAASPSSPQAPSGEVFLIQVASFKDRARAEALLRELRAEGLTARSEEVKSGSAVWHRVVVLGGQDRESAQRLAESIRAKHRVEPIVRRGRW